MKKLEAVKKGDDWEVTIKIRNVYSGFDVEKVKRLAMLEGLAHFSKVSPGYIVATDGYDKEQK